MDHQLYYLELSSDPIRFDSVSQLTNVFFDDSNRQVFAVRSGGATGIVVKKGSGDSEDVMSFCMDDKGPIRSIKFSPDNKILAVQRTESSIEFTTFNNQQQPNLTELINYKGKNSLIYGIVWICLREVALISNGGIELLYVNIDKKQLKLIKSINLTTNWFTWCPTGNLAVLASNNGVTLTPILIKQGIITKLPKLDWDNINGIRERDVTLYQIYGILTILITRLTSNRQLEIIIYLLNGPGLAPKLSHILRIGGTGGRIAINIVDDLIVVHQSTGTSLIYDIALSCNDTDVNGVCYHDPIAPAKPMRPFTLKLPSLSFDEQTMNCDLYSSNWVLFQPDIVIDAKLGCLWYVQLKLESLCQLILDRVKLVEFLLQRTNGKTVLVKYLKDMMTPKQYNGTLLPVIEKIFDKLNIVYKTAIDIELQNQIAQPSTVKHQPKISLQPRVLIDQSDLFIDVFTPITDTDYIEQLLMIYLQSLAKYNIAAQQDLSKMIIMDLVRKERFDTLQNLIDFSLINESKLIACFILSLSNVHTSITQMALDMLRKLNADSIIVEVLLGQGKIIDALRLASTMPGAERLSARKYLEAAIKAKDSIIFYTVYTFFQQRNIRCRGSPDFLKSELCEEYIQHYQNLFCN